MKNSIAINLIALLFVLTVKVDAVADWKVEWERVVEAAKKEGRVNSMWAVTDKRRSWRNSRRSTRKSR